MNEKREEVIQDLKNNLERVENEAEEKMNHIIETTGLYKVGLSNIRLITKI